jgi:glucose-1-phosphate thymidylyltransferase
VRGSVDGASRIEGKVRIGEGTRVVDSVIRGPAVVGEACHIERAYVGPYTSIASGCTVMSSEVENSILLEGAQVRDLDRRIEGSLIGCHAEIGRADGRPRAYRLTVGDNSRIGL